MILILEERVFPEVPWKDFDFMEALEHENGVILLAETQVSDSLAYRWVDIHENPLHSKGTIVGYVVALDMNAGILEVANLVVEPRYQSKVL